MMLYYKSPPFSTYTHLHTLINSTSRWKVSFQNLIRCYLTGRIGRTVWCTSYGTFPLLIHTFLYIPEWRSHALFHSWIALFLLFQLVYIWELHNTDCMAFIQSIHTACLHLPDLYRSLDGPGFINKFLLFLFYFLLVGSSKSPSESPWGKPWVAPCLLFCCILREFQWWWLSNIWEGLIRICRSICPRNVIKLSFPAKIGNIYFDM